MQTIGHGTTLQLGGVTGAGGTTFTTIAGVTAIDFGSNKTDQVDITHMTSPGGVRQFIPGLEDPGDVSVKLNVIPGDASQTSLDVTKAAKTNYDWKVVYPGNVRTKTFSATILSIDESIPDDKQPTFSMKLKVSGIITNASGS